MAKPKPKTLRLKKDCQEFLSWHKEIAIYGGRFYLLIGSGAALRQHLKNSPYWRNEVDEHGRSAGASFAINPTSEMGYERPLYMVWLREFGGCRSDLTSLSHECMHSASTALNDCGVKLSRETEEAFAYLHDWLYQTSLAWLWKHYNLPRLGKDVKQ